MQNRDDIKNQQTLSRIDDYLKSNKNDKGQTLSKDEIEALRFGRRLIAEQLEIPSYEVHWSDGTTKSTKISFKDQMVRIIPESEDEIYGQYYHSPDKKYFVVTKGSFWTDYGKTEKFTKGWVFLFEGNTKCLWKKEFIAPDKAYVNNNGNVVVIDSLNTDYGKKYTSGLFIVDKTNKDIFTRLFTSILDKVLYSQKRNELLCLTNNPERAFFLVDLATQKVIYKAKLKRAFEKWYLENANYSFKDDHINIWNEDLFEHIRTRLQEEEDIKTPSDDQAEHLEHIQVETERTTEEYEREQFLEIYTKPEFSIFEEYEILKCEKEGKEFEGLVSEYYFDYLHSMGISTMDDLLNTDITVLINRTGDGLRPGPGRIYGINNRVSSELGRQLKGIEDYIPVSPRIRTELEKIGVNKLGDCANFSRSELLKIKGIGVKVLEYISSALQEFHQNEIK